MVFELILHSVIFFYFENIKFTSLSGSAFEWITNSAPYEPIRVCDPFTEDDPPADLLKTN